jgi:ferritin
MLSLNIKNHQHKAMISKKMENLLNEQFNKELYSANLYLSMASYLLAHDFDGFANFFRVQAQEENMHAMKQFDYIHQVDGKITFKKIEAPQTEFASIKEVFELTQAHEKEVTKSIHKIAGQALEEKDFATHSFIQWFINEQVEEEATVKQIVQKLKMIGDNTSALYLLNEELGRRTFTATSAKE